MPHIGGKEDKDQTVLAKQSNGDQSGKDTSGSDKLLSLAATASMHAPKSEIKREPALSVEDEQSNLKVTPSPFGSAHPPPHTYSHPPFYGYESRPPPLHPPFPMYERNQAAYGAGIRRLFPHSPIRYNRAKSEEEDSDDKAAPVPAQNNGFHFRGPPGPPGPHNRHPYYIHHPSPHPYPQDIHSSHNYGQDDPYSRNVGKLPSSPIRKRQQLSSEDEGSPKRLKGSADQQYRSPQAHAEEASIDELGAESDLSSGRGQDDAAKQRVISPSSSVENANGKSHEEELSCGSPGKKRKTDSAPTPEASPSIDQQGPARFMPYPQAHEVRYAPPPHYPPAYYPAYGYPAPPGPQGWRMSPSGPYPPPPPPSHRAAHSSYPPSYPAAYGRPVPCRKYPPNSMEPPSEGKGFSGTSPKSTSPVPSSAPKIKSVADWQKATLATGKAPSTNRCMPLKAPIPSRYWGEAERAKGSHIPDFHQLVNFPDYLTKIKPSGPEPIGPLGSTNPDGKRPCVMCGKHRVCSQSTANLGGKSYRPKKADGQEEVDESDSHHIIPRQNKGLCTACDITVWVYVESGLEIKWCKGCKNFRPWAAFGDKGLATKCTRCRDRQREKYALQKDELKLRRMRQNVKEEEKKEDKEHEMAAAKGLRDLMAASVSI